MSIVNSHPLPQTGDLDDMSFEETNYFVNMPPPVHNQLESVIGIQV